jgi:isopentenyldiphosphate isomerase
VWPAVLKNSVCGAPIFGFEIVVESVRQKHHFEHRFERHFAAFALVAFADSRYLRGKKLSGPPQ